MIVAAATHSEDKWKFKDVVKETKSFKRQILEERKKERKKCLESRRLCEASQKYWKEKL